MQEMAVNMIRRLNLDEVSMRDKMHIAAWIERYVWELIDSELDKTFNTKDAS